MDKQWMTEYFYPRFWHNSIMHGSDKFIVLLLKKSIAIMIKGKIWNKRVRKSFLEGKKSRSFWLRLFFGRWKGAGFLCWSRQSPEQPKDGAFFLRCETMERANLNKHGTKQVAGRNAVSIRKPAYASSQAEAGRQSWQGSREIPKPSWGETENALTAAFDAAGIQQKEERKKDIFKKRKIRWLLQKKRGNVKKNNACLLSSLKCLKVKWLHLFV